MNEQQFDKLFRERLSGYTQSPTPEANRKLNEKLNDRQRGIWIQLSRLAAVLAVIAISIYVVYSWERVSNEDIAAVPTQEETVQSNDLPQSTEDQTPEVEQLISANARPQKKNDQQPIQTAEKPTEINTAKPAATSNVRTPTLAENEPVQPTTLIADNEPIVIDESNDEPQVEEEPISRKVKITYKRSQSSQKSLATNDTIKTKNGAFKRFWRKAQMVDYNLAGIRATKDQLMAINKKNKSKDTKSN